ncbi:MFS transporter [Sphingobacterium humi]|uniref:MFS transporter n=1 Tax=Sphingobacterium humi TaxID=1796905 RepID=A0A6N8L4I8_9SPHI|nr:MFS transporter [Sphingobacterium humi]MVZ62682.1 MFS transporter [Sphingobacterium humi]
MIFKKAATYQPDKTSYPILIAICFAHLANDLVQAVIPASYPLLKENFHLTFAQIGVITFCFQLASSLLQPVVGHYTDKHPQPYSQIIGMLFSFVGIIALSVAHSYYAVLFAVTMVGIGSSIFHPESSRVAYLSSGGKRSFAQSIFQIGGNTGTALAPLLMAWVVLPKGQLSILWFIAVVLIAQLILGYIARWYVQVLAYSRTQAKKAIQLPDLSQGRIVGAIIVLLILIFSKYVYVASITSYLQFYLMDKFAISEISAQVYLFYFLIAIALGTLFGGFLGDIIGRKYIIWLSVLGCAPFTMLLPYANEFWTGILVSVIGLIMASAFPSILVYAQELLPKKIGMVSGLFYGFAFGMGGLGAAILGWFADQTSLEVIYLVCSYLPLLGVVAYFLPDMKKIGYKPSE